MKILEVRDGFIVFEADNSVHLSSFVQTDGIAKNYVAQVVQIKRAGSLTIASAKILFLYDGTLQVYDNTLPSKDSEIQKLTFDILNNSIDIQNPIIAGKTQGETLNIVIDESAFDKKMLLSVDNNNDKNIIIKNIARQFNNAGKNVVIIDTHGIIDANKYSAGVDFKLPLDTASLTFMYEECLNDATSESKSLIIEIFKDLSDYSKTVSFVPFGALKTIVDDMVDKSHVFKLLVLKNKLAKLDKLGCFAKDKNEVDKINTILSSKCAVIDLSKLDRAFQNRYLSFLYEKLAQKDNVQVLLELSNTVSKKNLKNIIDSNVKTIFSARSQFQYLNDIKKYFDNFIITPSAINNEVFKIYSTMLKSMPEKTYLLTGEALNYIPMVSKLEDIQDNIANEAQEEVDDTVLEEIAESAEEITTETEENIVEPEEEIISNEEILTNIEEKSEAIIQEAAKDLTAPPENMFGDDEETETLEEVAEVEPQNEVIEEVTEAILGNSEEELIEQEEEAIINEDLSDDEVLEELSEEVLEEPNEDNLEIDEHNENLIEGSYETIEVLENSEEYLNENLIEGEISILEESTEEPQIKNNNEEFLTDFSTNEDFPDAGKPIILEMPEDFNVDFTENDVIEEPVIELETQEEIEEIPDVMPISDDNSIFDEIIELDPNEVDEDAIIIDMEDEEEENIPLDDEEIVKEVDKVFTTRKEDDISDSDLDLIDELNSDDVELQLEEDSNDDILQELSDADENDGILEEPQEEINLREAGEDEILETRNSATPIVPVYDADIPQEDLVISDTIEQGDTVTHAKYGSGVVEKMIKYGNKTLFSINFENVGRRLLDPTLTEIKKA